MDNVESWTVVQLRAELKRRGLSTQGLKAILIHRLKQSLVEENDRTQDVESEVEENNQDESTRTVNKSKSGDDDNIQSEDEPKRKISISTSPERPKGKDL